MEEHIHEHLSIPQICKDNLIGRSLLQQVFRDNTGYGIIDYFSLMKINAAKRLIRDGEMNFPRLQIIWAIIPFIIFPGSSKNLFG